MAFRAIRLWREWMWRAHAGSGDPPGAFPARDAAYPPAAEVPAMQDVDLFLSLAEIAGVFVGFGALIAIRSGGPAETFDVLMIGMVVWCAILVVIVALAPVVVSRFDVSGHALWLTCSVFTLLLFFVGDEVVVRVSKERQAFLAAAPIRRRWRSELASGVVTWIPATIALVLVVLGALPQQEAALYFLAAVLFLLMAALLLLSAVFHVGFSAYPAPGVGEGSDTPAAGASRLSRR